MKPKNGGLEDDFPFQVGDFLINLQGVSLVLFLFPPLISTKHVASNRKILPPPKKNLGKHELPASSCFNKSKHRVVNVGVQRRDLLQCISTSLVGIHPGVFKLMVEEIRKNPTPDMVEQRPSNKKNV